MRRHRSILVAVQSTSAFLTCALMAVVATGCVTINLRPGPAPLQETTLSGTARDKILVLDITGFIAGEPRGASLLGERQPSLVATVDEALTRAEKDRRVRGLILRVNSPGGTVTASDTIYQRLEAYQQRTKTPIVAHMMDLATSGAYYIAQAADRIVAQPTTVTGSIGVIMVRPGVEGLLTKLGIETTEIASGPYKGMGSPLRPLSEEEHRLFQGVIDDLYGRFLETVDAGRPRLDHEQIRALADGRIYTAQQALSSGLVDEIGYLDTAIQRVKDAAQITDARVIMYTKPGEYRGSPYAGPLVQLDLGALEPATPGFLYLWRP